jgi:hypothetical protein
MLLHPARPRQVPDREGRTIFVWLTRIAATESVPLCVRTFFSTDDPDKDVRR